MTKVMTFWIEIPTRKEKSADVRYDETCLEDGTQ